MIKNLFIPLPSSRPPRDLQTLRIDPLTIGDVPKELTRVTWFGHSALMLEINGRVVLLDPMFGPVPAPFNFLGRNRYSAQLPVNVTDFPKIDVVVMSHDHYDHLDYHTILALKSRVGKWVTTLGVARHLEAWGIPASNISELDWGQQAHLFGIDFTCLPARHFSGRGFTDRAKSLWSSWAIITPNVRIYFGADSGYGPHFRQIAESHGPFDIAFIECGQYNELWRAIHMLPEESAQAAKEIDAAISMPIHWGAFTLAFHSWTDPVDQFARFADELGVAYTTPRIGEQFVVGGEYPKERWWNEIG